MFNTAYDTTICKKVHDKALAKILLQTHVGDPLQPPRSGLGAGEENVLLITPSDDYDDIPEFNQPVVIEDLDRTKKIIVDIRPFASKGRASEVYRITAHNDYNTAMAKAILQERLVNGRIQSFAGQMNYVWRVFDRWINGAIINHMNLRNELDVQIRLSILNAIYFQILFYDDMAAALTEESEVIKYKAASLTNTNMTLVGEVYDKIKRLENIEDYCNCIATVTGSIRLDHFKFAGLFNMISNSWYGVGSKETVGVALEHIPTLFALVYTAKTDRSYRRTKFGQIIDSLRDRQAEDRFLYAMKDLLLHE